MTAGVGTPYWVAPELLEGVKYDERSDIYSFGVVLFKLLSAARGSFGGGVGTGGAGDVPADHGHEQHVRARRRLRDRDRAGELRIADPALFAHHEALHVGCRGDGPADGQQRQHAEMQEQAARRWIARLSEGRFLTFPEGGVFIMIVVVIGGLRWMPVARLVRAQFLSLREKEFVEAARALGASRSRQVIQHILPNALGPVIVAATIDVAAAIIQESTLSFLGLGFPPDIPTWGRLLADAKDYLDIAPHWALASGAAIFLTVLSINFIGDGLRDAFDPRRVL